MKILQVIARDIRFPTSLELHGSDAVHKSPDYSAVYVTIKTDRSDGLEGYGLTDRSDGLEGYGLTFTVGRGNELVMGAAEVYAKMITGMCVEDIFNDFGTLWRNLVHEEQLRWLGPEKGVIHLALAAVINALWDLWARIEGKPVWKLLADMPPEKLVSTVDFSYISDVMTREEAIEILRKNASTKEERIQKLQAEGFPAYTTSAGWLGYTDKQIEELCQKYLNAGWTRFKMKVGNDVEDDRRRAAIIRKTIGPERFLAMDSNQRWDVPEAIEYMKKLAEFKPVWIEEPTSPDDVLGHATISQALAPYGIGVATGEHCQNRVMFKQFLQAKGFQFCQIDSCRVGGINEILAILFMAAKFEIPVCPHAGGVGLCEYVQHLSMFDYICVSATLENRVTEFSDHLHEHFVHPAVATHGSYLVPTAPGYSAEMKTESLDAFEFPNGSVWKQLISEGKFSA